MADPTETLPASGPLAGEHLSAFIVDDVTGSFADERLCYVCHFGDGPVVLVFVREVDEQLGDLGAALDDWVERDPKRRTFITVSSADPEGDAEELRELAAARGLRLPLTLSSEGEFGPHLYRLHPRVGVTAVLYRGKEVVLNRSAAALTPEFRAELMALVEEHL